MTTRGPLDRWWVRLLLAAWLLLVVGVYLRLLLERVLALYVGSG